MSNAYYGWVDGLTAEKWALMQDAVAYRQKKEAPVPTPTVPKAPLMTSTPVLDTGPRTPIRRYQDPTTVRSEVARVAYELSKQLSSGGPHNSVPVDPEILPYV